MQDVLESTSLRSDGYIMRDLDFALAAISAGAETPRDIHNTA